MSRIRDFLLWTLKTRTNALSYLSAYSSLAIGFFWTFLRDLPDIRNTLIFKEGLVIGNGTWGILLFVGSIVLMLGLRFKKCHWVKYGSMINFVMWAFAAFLYAGHQYWYALISFAVYHVLVQGYFFLAASLDLLWNEE